MFSSTAHRGKERKGKLATSWESNPRPTLYHGVSVAEPLVLAVTIRPSSPYVRVMGWLPCTFLPFPCELYRRTPLSQEGTTRSNHFSWIMAPICELPGKRVEQACYGAGSSAYDSVSAVTVCCRCREEQAGTVVAVAAMLCETKSYRTQWTQ